MTTRRPLPSFLSLAFLCAPAFLAACSDPMTSPDASDARADTIGTDVVRDVPGTDATDTRPDTVASDASDASDAVTVDATPTDTGVDAAGSDVAMDSATDSGAMDAAADTVATDATIDSGAMDAGTDVAPDVVVDTGVDVAADRTDVTAVDATDAVVDTGVDVPVDTAAVDTGVDVAVDVPAVDVAPDVVVTPYRHTITIDGTNDFTPSSEQFTTTTSGSSAYVTWDADALYIGYSATDVASGSSTHWLLVYLDNDPGAGTGATTGEPYNTQRPAFPTGYGAEHYFAWRADNSFTQLRSFSGGTWSTVTPSGVTVFQSGTFVEMRIPLASIGSPSRVGVVSFMLNEQGFAEFTFNGLYSGSFTDGYYTSIPIGAYLDADLASARSPNDPANRRP